MDALGLMRLTCTVANGSYVATYQMAALDGTPLFFPVDADTFTPLNAAERVGAQAAPPYANWVAEAGMPKHNFHFTSEVRYWFQYDAARPYVLDFTGDDDVWVFINRKLAVDLGGIHTPVQGSVTFGMGQAAANTRFGLRTVRCTRSRVPRRAQDQRLVVQADAERVQRRARASAAPSAATRSWASARSATTA